MDPVVGVTSRVDRVEDLAPEPRPTLGLLDPEERTSGPSVEHRIVERGPAVHGADVRPAASHVGPSLVR
jgi:hypothetical protein